MKANPGPRLAGFTIWMTGLPAAGKSTLAASVGSKLVKDYGRLVEIMDGDEVRKGLSRDLGLSREDREEHARRVSYLAKVLNRNGVVAVVALISPYKSTREAARELLGAGSFLEVYVSTPLGVCERRDPKGLYAKARRGEITNMTGIQDPYEPPERADVVIDMTALSPEGATEVLLAAIHQRGLV